MGSAAPGASSSSAEHLSQGRPAPPDITVEVIPDDEDKKKEMMKKHFRKSMAEIFKQVIEDFGSQGLMFRRAVKEEPKEEFPDDDSAEGGAVPAAAAVEVKDEEAEVPFPSDDYLFWKSDENSRGQKYGDIGHPDGWPGIERHSQMMGVRGHRPIRFRARK